MQIQNITYAKYNVIPMLSRISKHINSALVRFQSGEQIAENVKISLTSILLHNSGFLQQVLSNSG